MFPFQAEPNWTPWKKDQLPGAHLWTPCKGLAPGWGSGIHLGRVHKSLFLFNIIEVFELRYVWPLTYDQFALGDSTRGKLPLTT